MLKNPRALDTFFNANQMKLYARDKIVKIGAIEVNQRFLVIESNFCWYYLKNILLYL